MITRAQDLPIELAAELATLQPFGSLAAATDAINGKNGSGGLRLKYIERLYASGCGDVLTVSIGAAINLILDRELALRAPIQDGEHAGGRGWTSHDVSCLTESERNNL